ncbi:hypothetical protein FOPG_17547 [Fusarium oxysporum f. sp. conglutinans race 2 54008]|uniref:Zn(2)-C6 fungal-type domain-containing protein n=1 Tax=Fusarium oxysporum f. sp. conglutinans race 2 54008 TaxID=1089457 RepID=X0H2M8_FUSOX|nr:hypothetical protein FOPG_17547 [Fusarium oxysporum f. sp. conglutinans race 2 54008]
MLPTQRLKKKPHQKSRNGCINCKLRKVKTFQCDESQPRCTNCDRFRLDCRYRNLRQSVSVSPPTVVPQVDTEPAHVAPARRKRGRPRKDWTSQGLASETHIQPESSQPLLSSDTELNITQAELLHQFITCTGPNLGGSDDPNHPIVKFWSRNATLLAISHPYLLHLSLSLAAYHLAFLASETEPSKAHHTLLARHHFSVGLTQANEALSSIDTSTCGSLYM